MFTVLRSHDCPKNGYRNNFRMDRTLPLPECPIFVTFPIYGYLIFDRSVAKVTSTVNYVNIL